MIIQALPSQDGMMLRILVGALSYVERHGVQLTRDYVESQVADKERQLPNPAPPTGPTLDHHRGMKTKHPAKRRRFSFREEANAVTCLAFRIGFIEALHAGADSEFLDRPGLMRVTAEELERMLTEGAARIAELLNRKRSSPERYWEFVASYNQPGGYVAHWDRSERPRRPTKERSGPAPFPGSVEAEAQGIARCTFGQSAVAALGEGERSELLTRPELSRITQIEMAMIMIGTSDQMAGLLQLEADDAAQYAQVLREFAPRVASRARSQLELS